MIEEESSKHRVMSTNLAEKEMKEFENAFQSEEASRSNEGHDKTAQGGAALLTRRLILFGRRCSSLSKICGCGGRLRGGSIVVCASAIFLEDTTLERLGSGASDTGSRCLE